MSPDTRQAIQQIRTLWDTGDNATLPAPKDPGYELARNAHRFHECYSQEELEELLTLLAKHKPPWGYSHVWKLVSIEDKRLRKRVQRLAIKGKWGRSRLQAEIIALRGRVKHGGRRRAVTGDVAMCMVKLDQEVDRWLRLLENITRATTLDGVDLPPAVNEQIHVIWKEVRTLRDKLGRASERKRS